VERNELKRRIEQIVSSTIGVRAQWFNVEYITREVQKLIQEELDKVKTDSKEIKPVSDLDIAINEGQKIMEVLTADSGKFIYKTDEEEKEFSSLMTLLVRGDNRLTWLELQGVRPYLSSRNDGKVMVYAQPISEPLLPPLTTSVNNTEEETLSLIQRVEHFNFHQLYYRDTIAALIPPDSSHMKFRTTKTTFADLIKVLYCDQRPVELAVGSILSSRNDDRYFDLSIGDRRITFEWLEQTTGKALIKMTVSGGGYTILKYTSYLDEALENLHWDRAADLIDLLEYFIRLRNIR